MQKCVASNYSENTYLNINKNKFKYKRANSWTTKELETLSDNIILYSGVSRGSLTLFF